MLTQENLTNNRNQLGSSLNKLSSGLRITKASDDASGLAIADKLRTEANSIRQGIHNAHSAIAFIQIGDKAMNEQSKILDFTKQKLLQAATSTTSDDGRSAILKDIQKQLQQYDNIASQTNYNGITILQKDANDTDPTLSHDFFLGCGESSISISDIQCNTSYGGTEQIDKLTISGEIKENDIFTVNLNGTTISYIASSSDAGTSSSNHNSVALGIKSAIESNPTLASLVSVDNTADGELTLTGLKPGQGISIQPGTITLNTDISLQSSNLVSSVAQVMTYEFSGTIEEGDTYTVGGVTYTVQSSDTSMNDVIDKIVQGLNGTDGGTITGLSVSSTLSDATATRNASGQLVLTADVAGTPFTPPSYSTTNLPSIDDQAISMSVVQPNVEEVVGVTMVPQEYFLELTGTSTPEIVDTYTVKLWSGSTLLHTINYAVQSTDSTEDDVLDGLLSAITTETASSPYNFSVIKENGGLTIKGETTYSVQFQTSSSSFQVPIDTVPDTNQTQYANVGQLGIKPSVSFGITNTYSFNSGAENDTFEVGDTITFTLTPTDTITYTVQSSDLVSSYSGSTLYKNNVETNYNVLTQISTLINNNFNSNVVASTHIGWIDQPSIHQGHAYIEVQGIGYDTWDTITSSDTPIDTIDAIFTTTGFDPTWTIYDGIGGTTTEHQDPIVSQQSISTFSITGGSIIEGSVAKIALGNGDTISYTIQSSDSTYENVMDGLLSVFNASSYKTEMVTIVDSSSGTTSSVNLYDLTKDVSGNLLLKSYSDHEITTTSYLSTDVPHNFTITKLSTKNFTPEITLIENYVEGTPSVSPENQQVQYTLSGTVEEGDTYRIGTMTYIVQASDTSIDDVVDAFFIGFSGGSRTGLTGSPISGVSPSIDVSGNLLLTADVAGTPFVTPDYEALNKGTDDQDIQLVNTIDNVTAGYESIYDISGFINTGNSYDIGGAIYTVQSGDNKSDIIDGLAKAINGDITSGVSGSPLSGVIAYKNSLNQLVIKSESGPVSNYALDSNTNLSNLTPSELNNDMTISANTVTLTSSNSKYVTYSENSIPDDTDETQNIATENIATAESLSVLKNLNELSIETSRNFLKIVDNVLNTLNEFRSRFGSTQNQIESALRTMLTCETNIRSAESVIRDVDYASETANFQKSNIIEQGAVFSQQKIKEQQDSILNILQSSGR